MAQTRRDELRRERLREYEAALSAARSPVEVLSLFAKAREDRASGEPLEEAFAAASVDGIEDADLLPAAVWVALRQGDADAAVQALVQSSSDEFVLAEHEQLDASYRLTTVEERRALPDVARLQSQVASFLHIPRDVVVMVASWGADDPRTASEVETLVDQRFGSAPHRVEQASVNPPRINPPRINPPKITPSRAGREMTSDASAESVSTTSGAVLTTSGASLSVSSAEFAALLNLTPEQDAVLATLVRQATITISGAL